MQSGIYMDSPPGGCASAKHVETPFGVLKFETIFYVHDGMPVFYSASAPDGQLYLALWVKEQRPARRKKGMIAICFCR